MTSINTTSLNWSWYMLRSLLYLDIPVPTWLLYQAGPGITKDKIRHNLEKYLEIHNFQDPSYKFLELEFDTEELVLFENPINHTWSWQDKTNINIAS